MYLMTNLVEEIAELINGKIKEGITCNPNWITQQILANHPDLTGSDADFYTCTARETIREKVRKRINKFKLMPDSQLQGDSQVVIPGFERLQRAYLTDQDGEQVAISIEKMTHPQLCLKVTELRAMGDGCYLHADELERYIHDNYGPKVNEARLVV